MYGNTGNILVWNKFSKSMLDGLHPQNTCSICIQNTSGVHYDVVLDVGMETVNCPAEGVQSVQRFAPCKKCQTLVKCPKCGLSQLFNKCQQRLIANVMFLKAGNPLSLIMFEDKPKQLYNFYKSQLGQ